MLQHPADPTPVRRPHRPTLPDDPGRLLRHDLRSLLTPIKGHARPIRRAGRTGDGAATDECPRHAERIERAVEALAARIDRVGDGGR